MGERVRQQRESEVVVSWVARAHSNVAGPAFCLGAVTNTRAGQRYHLPRNSLYHRLILHKLCCFYKSLLDRKHLEIAITSLYVLAHRCLVSSITNSQSAIVKAPHCFTVLTGDRGTVCLV
jgi:hypothetical protein